MNGRQRTKFPEKGTAHAAISATNGSIFSSSFKVGIMIETEFENESVILKCQTFNAQPAFGKPTAPQARQRSVLGLQQFAMECLQPVLATKNAWIKRFGPRRGNG